MFENVLSDLRANVDVSRHGRLRFWIWVAGKALLQPQIQVVLLYRASSVLARSGPLRPLAFLLRSLAVVLGGTEIHPDARIGPGLALLHSVGVVVGGEVVIGRDARISQLTCIGEPGRGARRQGMPTLGDHVTVGVGAVILGPLRIGDRAVVGAAAVVTKDVPAGAIVGGTPARVIGWVEGYGPSAKS
ncbi:serine O-acetyltransferase [Nocardioides sp. NPDC057772]|uniref:serine O-acetyltransferase n=1 Tax=Nocardioides sp. NPDC057772 TaxID=3346245 RepID=UPI00367053CF